MSGVFADVRKSVPAKWTVSKLSDMASIASGTTPARSEQSRYFEGGCTPWVKTGDLNNGVVLSTEESLTPVAINECSVKVFPAETVLVAMYGGFRQIGRTGRLSVPSAVNQALSALSIKDKALVPAYVQVWLNTRVTLWRRFAASSRKDPNITGTDVAAFPIAFPNVAEQRRIAGLSSTWNQAIEVTEQLIVATQKRKQALMHKVLQGVNGSRPQSKLGRLFEQKKAKGTKNLPTYSVTMYDGLVLRDSLERKNETSLRPDQHLLIEKNDIAYNMMRMWQGASGLAPESGLVSPAYVVLRSLGDVDPLFASYWFKTPRVVKKFQDYSHGLTKDRLRLYYKDFASIALPVPPLELQRKIARTLSACDRELDYLCRKVDLLKQQKKGLMQQLLTGQIRVKLPKVKGKK